MHKSWFTWVIVAAVVVTVFIGFNHQGEKDAVPLSQIFPEEEAFPIDVEYEFVDENAPAGETVKLKTAEKKESLQPVAAPQALSQGMDLAAAEVQQIKSDYNFTIQIASFKDEKKAQDGLAKIRAKIPSAYVSRSDLGSKGVWYRIYAGQFEGRSEAEVSLNDIKRDYTDSFIISPKTSK